MSVQPGVLEIPSVDYHADNLADVPSLSRTVACALCNDSPLHAWTIHPRLNPNYKQEEKEDFDIGTVAHDLLLFGAASVEVIIADSWRTKAAQEARDAARAAGRQPLLPHQMEAAEEMVAAARKQLEQHEADPAPFTAGLPEQTLVWEEPGGVVCRARLDWLRVDLQAVDDFKTAKSANPDSFTSRSFFTYGYDIQAAFYRRGVLRLTGELPAFRFVVVEKQPPYALSVVAPGPDVLTIAEKKIDYAIDLWRRCLDRGVWPGYEPRVAYAELPAWEEARWLAREEIAA